MAAALLPDPLWDLVEPFLPIPPRRPQGGRPPFGAGYERGISCRGLPCAAASMAVDWAGGGGSWSARLPGSISFAACVCGMKSGPTSMRHFCHSAVHSFAGSSCERRGRRAERLSAVLLGPRSEHVGVISASGAPRAPEIHPGLVNSASGGTNPR